MSFKNIKKSNGYIGGYAERLFIIRVLGYYTFTHASMDSVLYPIPLSLPLQPIATNNL
jgi:hypothetical protein